MKKWTLDNLKYDCEHDEANTELHANGCWSDYVNRYELNYSNIQSRLIQEAGRWCEYYASDILYDLSEIESELSNPALERSTFFFGFRKMGVDHTDFILSRLNGGSSTEVYRAVWKLEIFIYENKACSMRLCKIIL